MWCLWDEKYNKFNKHHQERNSTKTGCCCCNTCVFNSSVLVHDGRKSPWSSLSLKAPLHFHCINRFLDSHDATNHRHHWQLLSEPALVSMSVVESWRLFLHWVFSGPRSSLIVVKNIIYHSTSMLYEAAVQWDKVGVAAHIWGEKAYYPKICFCMKINLVVSGGVQRRVSCSLLGFRAHLRRGEGHSYGKLHNPYFIRDASCEPEPRCKTAWLHRDMTPVLLQYFHPVSCLVIDFLYTTSINRYTHSKIEYAIEYMFFMSFQTGKEGGMETESNETLQGGRNVRMWAMKSFSL